MEKQNAFLINGNTITIGQKNIQFEYPIDSDYTIQVNQVLIILLNVPVGVVFNENVFAIDLNNGNILWQIGKLEFDLKECPYVGIGLETDKLILLVNWCSTAIVVDPVDGTILERRFAK